MAIKNHNGLSSVCIKSSTGSVSELQLSDVGISLHDGYLNYANPLLSEVFRSYHRDEIYRFAAVFYDGLGRKSEAKWIADIRFPANYEKDANWSASSFEMPSEIDDNIYNSNMSFSGITLSSQELLVKPLGLSFTFNNIPTNVKKIEIVRSKRDLNNRTIIAQGVTQKTGTRYTEYSDTNVEFERGLVNTLRPHPTISMGYSYSPIGPYAPRAYANSNYYSEYLGYGAIHRDGRATGSPIVADNDIRSSFRYNDHAISPYYSNRNYYMFISPEVSYFKDEYVSSIKNTYPNVNLVISDIVYPKSTPNLLFSGSNYSNSKAIAYHGSDRMERAQFQYPYRINPISNAYFPTSMYFTADLNENIAISSNLFTTGLLGISEAYVYSINTPPESLRLYTTDGFSSSNSYLDIYPISTSHYEATNSVRAYISLNSAIDQTSASNGAFHYVNEYEGVTPSVIKYSKPTSGFSSTFKYFCNFNKNIGIAGSVGGESISLLYQNSRVLSDYTINTIAKVGDIRSFGISNMSYADCIDPAGAVGESGLLIASPSAKYTEIGGALFLNYHKGITRGDSSSAYAVSDYSLNLMYSSLMKTKVSGPHGDGIVFYVDNDNHIPSILGLDINRKKYLDGSTYIGYKNLDKYGASAMSTYIVNMKRMSIGIYGGASKSNRDYSEYISTGSVIIPDQVDHSANGVVFGGDTYIGLFDYTVIRATDPMLGNGLEQGEKDDWYVSKSATEMYQVSNSNALIPLESSINMRLSSSKSYITSGREPFIQQEPGIYNPTSSTGTAAANWIGVSAGVRPISFTQTSPQFSYNSAYSTDKVAGIFFI